MDLAAFDGKMVRIKAVWGEIFEGEAVHDSRDYCEHEYGWAEECLNLNHWLFRRSDIESVELLEGKPRIWMSRHGRKTIELRLNDPKRREIQVGDIICFEGVEEDNEYLHMEVKELLPFPSFRELYAALPLSEMGYSPEEEKNASPADMDKYYTPEEQARWGVLAIRVAEP